MYPLQHRVVLARLHLNRIISMRISLRRFSTCPFPFPFRRTIYARARASHKTHTEDTHTHVNNISHAFVRSSHPSTTLAGIFRGGHEVLVRSKLALSDGVTMQLTVRSTNAEVAQLLTTAVG